MQLRFLFLALLAGSCTSKPGAPGATAIGASGVVTFVSHAAMRQIDLSGGAVTELRAGVDPFRTADGIYYVAKDKKLCGKEEEDRCVMVLSTDGKAAVAVKPCKGCELPSLAPDGSVLAHSGYCREKTCGAASHATFLRDRKGKLLKVFPALGSPSWTPAGALVLSGDARQGKQGIFVAADHLKETQIPLTLPEGVADPKQLATSPDGSMIVFRCTEGSGELFVVPVGGGTAQRVTSLGEHTAAWPAFSPDGKWIIFQDKEKSWQDGMLSIVAVSGGSAHPVYDQAHQPIRADGRMRWDPR